MSVGEVARLAPPRMAEATRDGRPGSSGRRLGRWLSAIPSWLVSAVFHLVFLLALSLATLSLPKPPTPSVLIAATAADLEALTETEPAIEIEPQEMEAVALQPLANLDPGMANFGELAAVSAHVGDVGTAQFSAPAGDLGQLFGDRGDALARSDAGLSAAEFFGVKAGGRKFVFVVDSSRSMSGGKFDAALEELSYAVRKLNKDQFFYVIFFDWNAERMTFPVDATPGAALKDAPEPRAVRATPENVRHLERWMKTIELELKTDPYEAMKFAVEMLPDAIYLLTDGIFRGQTESYLAAHNVIEDALDGPKPKVVVHTIGFWSDEGQELLKRIAAKYGGTYRFVPSPNKRKKD